MNDLKMMNSITAYQKKEEHYSTGGGGEEKIIRISLKAYFT